MGKHAPQFDKLSVNYGPDCWNCPNQARFGGGERLDNDPRTAPATGPTDDRLSRLSRASLRINESLDFDTVLQGVLDAARSLTAAR